jgi:PPP family 3-phenylpropionic acid transporter
LAAGTALRLVAAPAGGRLADRLDAAKLVFAGCAGAASLMALLYLTAEGFWPLFAVSLLQAAALAPLAPLCDSLALGAGHRPDAMTRPGRGSNMVGCGVPAPAPSLSGCYCPGKSWGATA